MCYCRFHDFKIFTSIKWTWQLFCMKYNENGVPRITLGLIYRTLINIQISWHLVLSKKNSISSSWRETLSCYCPCPQRVTPVMGSYRRWNLAAICQRIFMLHLIYKSNSCYIPWPFPTEKLLITSSDSYWLPCCNTLNMQYFCQITFLKFTCNLSWSFWIISTSILKYKLKTMLTGNILSEVKWHMPDPWPISIW